MAPLSPLAPSKSAPSSLPGWEIERCWWAGTIQKAGVALVAIRAEGSQSAVCVGNVTGNYNCSTTGLAEFEDYRKLKALICRIVSPGLGPS